MRQDIQETMEKLTDEQIEEMIWNTEITCLILHTKPWKYAALCLMPYVCLKRFAGGRYDWGKVTPKTGFECTVIRLREDWKEILEKRSKRNENG